MRAGGRGAQAYSGGRALVTPTLRKKQFKVGAGRGENGEGDEEDDDDDDDDDDG